MKDSAQEKRESDFYTKMKAAFEHGRAYFSHELGSDLSDEDNPDDKLSFQKWFDTERKANNYCIKYNYKVEKMNTEICNGMQYKQ